MKKALIILFTLLMPMSGCQSDLCPALAQSTTGNSAAPGAFVPAAVQVQAAFSPASVSVGQATQLKITITNNNVGEAASTSVSQTVTANFTNPALAGEQSSTSNAATIEIIGSGPDCTAYNVSVPLTVPSWLAYSNAYQGPGPVLQPPTVANGLQQFNIEMGNLAPGASSTYILSFTAQQPPTANGAAVSGATATATVTAAASGK